MPRRGCQILPIDRGSNNEFMFEYVCKGKRVAAIHAARKKVAGKTRFVVRGVNVLDAYRRKGIATELYEVAAAEACRRRAPLASDERVGGGLSTEFWQKQLRKGRAVVLAKRGGYEQGGAAAVYSLECPAPTSLKGGRLGADVYRPGKGHSVSVKGIAKRGQKEVTYTFTNVQEIDGPGGKRITIGKRSGTLWRIDEDKVWRTGGRGGVAVLMHDLLDTTKLKGLGAIKLYGQRRTPTQLAKYAIIDRASTWEYFLENFEGETVDGITTHELDDYEKAGRRQFERVVKLLDPKGDVWRNI